MGLLFATVDFIYSGFTAVPVGGRFTANGDTAGARRNHRYIGIAGSRRRV